MIIEPIIINPVLKKQENIEKVNKLKVAAYCRVSTGTDEQLNSYENQIEHYKQHINNNIAWEFVGIYADESVSGTSLKKRNEFKRMIKDALDKKIDMILVKSISRFGRNSVDILHYVRLLKENNIAIFFEAERINTLNSDGEVLLSIFSSLAQDESRQISERVEWGNDKSFKKGRVYGNNNILGYDVVNGKLIVNEEQSKIVKFIFTEYLQGDGVVSIGKKLEKMNVKTATNKNKWHPTTILNILKNEKYCGHLLQQKFFTTNFLTHQRLKNKGEKRQYLFKNNHESIISEETFNKVQLEIERRKGMHSSETGRRNKHSNKYVFSGKLFCSDCKEGFRRTIWHKNTPSERVVWDCMGYARYGKKFCDKGAVLEEALQKAFVNVFNRLKDNQQSFVENYKKGIEIFQEISLYKNELIEVEKQIEDIKQKLKSLYKLKKDMIEEIYYEEKDELELEYKKLLEAKKQLESTNAIITNTNERLEYTINILNNIEKLEEFDEELFKLLIEKVEIVDYNHYKFYFYGSMIDEEILAFKSNRHYVLLDIYKCSFTIYISKYATNKIKNRSNEFIVEIYF